MPDPVADRFAIQDIMTRYAQGVDTRDLDLFETCFAPEVSVSGFDPGATFQNRDDWMAWVRAAFERFERTQHLIGNFVVEIDGDRATMRSYVQATHVFLADPKATFTLWATYHDVVERRPGGWVIVDHRLEPAASETRRPSE